MSCPVTITTDQINTAMLAAVAAQEAGDYATALQKVMSARMLMAAKPDSEFAREKLIWKPDAINQIYSDLLRMKNSSGQIGKITQIPVRRLRDDGADCSLDCC